MNRLELVDLYEHLAIGEVITFRLLAERTAQQSISHRKMPTCAEHRDFIAKRPYLAWYLIHVYDGVFTPELPSAVGACYLSKQREIGVGIFKQCQRMGYGKRAVLELMRRHPDGDLYANINPANTRSAEFFRTLGFELRQHTYAKRQPGGMESAHEDNP